MTARLYFIYSYTALGTNSRIDKFIRVIHGQEGLKAS